MSDTTFETQGRTNTNESQLEVGEASSGHSMQPPPFQLQANPSAPESEQTTTTSSPATVVQRHPDAREVTANVSAGRSTSSSGDLDAVSRRRVVERVTEIEGGNPAQAGEQFAAMTPDEQQFAYEDAVRRFQQSP
ncbi:MAG: hypothetical protein AAF570_13325, partial [Bacteroidota bacterium]